MELKIKVELDMTERMSGLLTGLLGLIALPRKPFENNSQGLPEEQQPEPQPEQPQPEQPQPEQPKPEQPVDEKVEADQLKGVMEVTIARYAGQDWKEKPTPENKKAVAAVSAVLREIARCVSGDTVDKPTMLEGPQRVRFVKEIDNIFTDADGMPRWNPF